MTTLLRMLGLLFTIIYTIPMSPCGFFTISTPSP